MPQEPGWACFNQLAMDNKAGSSTHIDMRSGELEVLFDTLELARINASCIRIYIRNPIDGTIKPATACLVRYTNQLYLLTVAHAFPSNSETLSTTSDANDDNECEFESDFEDISIEYDEEDVEATSRYSKSEESSSPDSDAYLYPVHSQPPSMSSTQSTGLRRPISPPSPEETPDQKYLSPIGHVKYMLTDIDSALVEIENTDLLMVLVEISNSTEANSRQIAPAAKDADISAQVSRGIQLWGRLLGTPSLMRLPNSRSFQKVYNVRFHGTLANGDCGSGVIDRGTDAHYGHIIAGCVQHGFAYMVSTRDAFEALEMAIRSKTQQDEGVNISNSDAMAINKSVRPKEPEASLESIVLCDTGNGSLDKVTYQLCLDALRSNPPPQTLARFISAWKDSGQMFSNNNELSISTTGVPVNVTSSFMSFQSATTETEQSSDQPEALEYRHSQNTNQSQLGGVQRDATICK
jgi:hypothetical protein